MKTALQKKYTMRVALGTLGMLCLLVAGCKSDLKDDEQGDDPQQGVIGSLIVGDVSNSQFELQFSDRTFEVVEGEGLTQFPVSIVRSEGHQNDIELFVRGVDESDEARLLRQYTDAQISADERQTQLRLAVDIGPLPIMSHERSIQVSAIDSNGLVSAQVLTVQVTPTSAPDVYLLVGQSNMVGNSENEGKQSEVGGADEPVDRIKQLNVTFNDIDNFPNEAAFTNFDNLIDDNKALTKALDPLHSGMESSGVKSGTRIGLGLSFAKRALADTTAEIFLVPAAWSDTGFCRRDTNILPGLGWSAEPQSDAAFSGTLLHDRAIARANIALDQTGGVLRGILWHQGEADSENDICATAYQNNLVQMAKSLRRNIQTDKRGASARQDNADIPFIVGTMAKGGEQSPFSETKLLVDGAHRTIGSALSFSGHVNADDLIPPDYACGAGTCIHFGADALRLMGIRYYDELVRALQ